MAKGREGANARIRRTYGKQAGRYDRSIDRWERLIMGPGHREWCCGHATGRTLEVAVGTGQNLPLYQFVVSLTAVDLTPEMLDVARKRVDDLGLAVDLGRADAQALPFDEGTFDTVVCTYALCSIRDMEAAIDEMVRVLRPGGRMVLLDHTVSTAPPLRWLQVAVETVSKRRGEYWTRRPYEYVQRLGLQIEDHGRFRAGVVERLVARV